MGNWCGRRVIAEDAPPLSDEESGYPITNTPFTSSTTAAVDANQSQVEPKKLDPKDFMFIQKSNQILVKPPGSIAGQQFIIEECKDCDIYLLDHSAQVNVDACQNCRIFVGPCESSVFLRDCQGCKCIIACQQLRLRDCQNMDMLIYVSASQPSIETSSNIRIGCFQFSYFSLKSQFIAANLPIWNSEWSNVHDFNKHPNEIHWSFLPPQTTANDLLKSVSEVCPSISLEEEKQLSPVPLTYGLRPRYESEACFVLIFSPYHDCGYDLLQQLQDKLTSQELRLIRSRQMRLNAGAQANLFGRPLEAASKGAVVGLQFDGEDSNSIINEMTEINVSRNMMFISNSSNGHDLCQKFFDRMAPTI